MYTFAIAGSLRPRRVCRRGHGFTLVELLVVLAIITLMTAILVPAVGAARARARQVVCQSNLRQFGIGMQAHAGLHRTFCSGAFDWARDGCVTEVGWVADLVAAGVPVGDMLCPSNPHQIAATYNQLLNLDATSPVFNDCVDRLGSSGQTAPDGATIVNPCRKIAEDALPSGSESRRELVEREIYENDYNTNYTASWWLVRSGVLLDSSGNPSSSKPGCEASLDARVSTLGPLTLDRADAAVSPSCFIPLMGCGGPAEPLQQQIGPHGAGVFTVESFTAGPVAKTTAQPIDFPDGTPYEGEDGWWAGWTHATLQDFRDFAPVHRDACNVLFADGSVRAIVDTNRDGYLNNGFSANQQTGLADDSVEMSPKEVFSAWSLSGTTNR